MGVLLTVALLGMVENTMRLAHEAEQQEAHPNRHVNARQYVLLLTAHTCWLL